MDDLHRERLMREHPWLSPDPKIAHLQSELEEMRTLALDLVNQLTLLTRDDQSYLWRIGGRPLDDAYLALKRVVNQET